MLTLFALATLLCGVSLLAMPDFWWGMTAAEGRKRERTGLWEAKRIFSGVVVLAIGLAGLLLVTVGVAVGNRRVAQRLNETYSAELATWHANASDTPQREQTDRPGALPNTEVIYGLCAGDSFYVYILHRAYTSPDHVAYIPDGSPGDCRPPEIPANADIRRLGNGWYEILEELEGDVDDSNVLTPNRPNVD